MTLGFAIGLFIFGIFYFLPTFIASSKNKRNTGAIFALNLFLGFTFIGWVIALVWTLTKDNLQVEIKK
ncbi:hypothetical protein COT98_00100 [Candidatus Falkowbacteria bacterium CG10_big_fil_rev_8_21_14_0_10_39_9]|uniref:Superinfection immunity protein n=1 Tax=Candidatus Falkowbacteria bacterium CG10_big_fil_rev_8_21_14_0_10_39_9 TaxID=1974566 RepID=A0A2M6WRL0_9BACT|nr:MAG: hypothetical protein COT98_00100 [Candidatus Falkowbacteria bacterium CG10_big_fil_rev_8_21_14_0_10_39_9]